MAQQLQTAGLVVVVATRAGHDGWSWPCRVLACVVESGGDARREGGSERKGGFIKLCPARNHWREQQAMPFHDLDPQLPSARF